MEAGRGGGERVYVCARLSPHVCICVCLHRLLTAAAGRSGSSGPAAADGASSPRGMFLTSRCG